MSKQTFAIDTGDGAQLAAGISAHEIDRAAQERADRLGESVWVYAEGARVASAREVKPVEIEVELDSATGPRVTYGEQEVEDVEAELPAGWEVDWSSAHWISALHTTPVRYAAALVGDKDGVLSWTEAATFVATYDDSDNRGDWRHGACDVSVQIGRAGLRWFLRTRDDANGSDECDDTAYPSEDAAIAAAEEYAEDHHEADPGEDAADYLARVRAEVEAARVEATCECGEWAEERCRAVAPASEMVVVDWMPGHLRGTHEAAGATMRPGMPGAVRARVAPACARHMLEVDGEWCAEVSA